MNGPICTDCRYDLTDLNDGKPCPSCGSTRRDVILNPATIHSEAQVFTPSIHAGGRINPTGTLTVEKIGQAVELPESLPLSSVGGADVALIGALGEFETATAEDFAQALADLVGPGVVVRPFLPSRDGLYSFLVSEEKSGKFLGKITDATRLRATWELMKIIIGHAGL